MVTPPNQHGCFIWAGSLFQHMLPSCHQRKSHGWPWLLFKESPAPGGAIHIILYVNGALQNGGVKCTAPLSAAALPSASEKEDTALYSVCKSLRGFPSAVGPEVKSGPAFIMQESFIYCRGFVKCLLSEAELHFPECPPWYVSRATSKVSGRDLKGRSKAAAIFVCLFL